MANKTAFESLNDEQLVELSRKGSDEANECLLLRYKNFVKAKVRPYFLEGADAEDVMQEGMIGLYGAIRDFDTSKKVPFVVFADLCVERRLSVAVKAATRKKHSLLNNAISLSGKIGEDSEKISIEDTLVSDEADGPENVLIAKEDNSQFEEKLERVLSALEKKVISLYLEGMSYADIAKTLSKDEKSIDNALQRVKNKLRK